MRQNDYSTFYENAVDNPEPFWETQAESIHWHKRWDTVLENGDGPGARWYLGGKTNLCYNAVDRHLAERGAQAAIVYVSSETGEEQTFSYNNLHMEVSRVASMFMSLGVQKGDRVLIYMPMIPQAVFAMLACARIGAIHAVVFGGFASGSLASRIDDAKPALVVCADAGSRGGQTIAYKPLVDEAIRQARHKPQHVLLFDRGLSPADMQTGRDHDWHALRHGHMSSRVPCVWVESSDPSYILYTSGTTGKPKGVQRDTGGYTVALAASMKYIFDCNPGETFFATSDIGWVVGHSYIVYGPLINGMTTVLYEGTPIRPDAGTWWRIVQDYKVSALFSAPTAVRVLKQHDPAFLTRYDLSSLKNIFLAGEPLDIPTSNWMGQMLNKPVIDNYWQTETGWPILALQRGVDPFMLSRAGSPGKPSYGFKVRLIDEATEKTAVANSKGLLMIEAPLPPGCMTTIWQDDKRYLETYWTQVDQRNMYSTFDWGIRDEDGYYFILGRSDDVINVAGHRLGTREIEECIAAHPAVIETAVVGGSDDLRGQVVVALCVLKHDVSPEDDDKKRVALEVKQLVDKRLGAIARPAHVIFVSSLPKTRSGKILRRIIQAVYEDRDTGDLTTIDDPTVLTQIKNAIQLSSGGVSKT